MSPNDESLVFSIDQFSRRYGLSRSTVVRQIDKGLLKTARAGARHLIPRSEADRWLNSKMEAVKSERAA